MNDVLRPGILKANASTALLLIFPISAVVWICILFLSSAKTPEVTEIHLLGMSQVSPDSEFILGHTANGYEVFGISESRHDILHISIDADVAEWAPDNSIMVINKERPAYRLRVEREASSCHETSANRDPIQDDLEYIFLREGALRDLLPNPRLTSGRLSLMSGAKRLYLYPVVDQYEHYISYIDSDSFRILVAGDAGIIITSLIDGAQTRVNHDVVGNDHQSIRLKYFLLPERNMLLRSSGYFSNDGNNCDGVVFDLCNPDGSVVKRLPIPSKRSESFEAVRLMLTRHRCAIFLDKSIFMIDHLRDAPQEN